MKNIRSILFVFIMIFASETSGQNLVLNGGFESGQIPTTSGEIDLATGWKTLYGSPDYFHPFAGILVQIPFNWWGHHWPVGTGRRYAGLFTYDNNGIPEGEQVYCKLVSPLTVGNWYRFEVSISLAERSRFIADSFGVGFTVSEPVSRLTVGRTLQPVTDTAQWIPRSITFRADSAYEYLVLGQMSWAPVTDTVSCGDLPISYYYIDSVSVTESGPVGITEGRTEEEFRELEDLLRGNSSPVPALQPGRIYFNRNRKIIIRN